MFSLPAKSISIGSRTQRTSTSMSNTQIDFDEIKRISRNCERNKAIFTSQNAEAISRIKQYESVIIELNNHLMNFNDVKSSFETFSEINDNKLNLLETEIKSVEQNISNLQAFSENFESNFEKETLIQKFIEEKIAEFSKNCTEFIEKIKFLEENKKNSDENIQNLEKNLQEFRQKNESLNQNISENVVKIAELSEKIKEITEKSENLENLLKIAENDKKFFEKNIEDLNEEIKKLNYDLKDKISMLNIAEMNNEKFMKLLDEAQEGLSLIPTFEGKINAQEQKINELTAQNEEIEEMKNENNSLKIRLENSEFLVQENQKFTEKITSENEKLKIEKLEFEQKLIEKTDILKKNETLIQSLEKNLDFSRNQVENLTADFEA